MDIKLAISKKQNRNKKINEKTRKLFIVTLKSNLHDRKTYYFMLLKLNRFFSGIPYTSIMALKSYLVGMGEKGLRELRC